MEQHQTETRNSPLIPIRAGGKRSVRTVSILVASTVALSLAQVKGFQNSFAPRYPVPAANRESTGAAGHGKRNSALCVMTDPNQLVRMELDERDRETLRMLEELYNQESDGLTNRISVDAATTSLTGRPASACEKKRLPSPRPATFKGLSMTPNPRSKKQISLSRELPTGEHRALKLETQPKSYWNAMAFEDVPAEAEFPTVSKELSAKQSTTRRSSTMPGFLERSSSRQKGFEDGIRLAENRAGRKFEESEESKAKRRASNGELMYKTSASVPDSMVQFAHEIHGIERITPTEEVTLGTKTQEAIRLQKIYDGLVDKLDREPTDEEWCAAAGKINMEAISQAIEEGLDAKNRLVTSNLRMVQGVVNVYIRNGLGGQYNAADLLQEGIMALIRAAEKFDPSKGFRFSTYAMYWIRAAIKRNQVYQSRVITVPIRLFESQKRLLRASRELTETLKRPPTKAELAKATDMSELQIDRCLEAVSQRCHSLDQRVSNPFKPNSSSSANQDTMNDMVASRTDDGGHDVLNQLFLREDLIETIHRNLSDEEAQILLLRYGLVDSLPRRLTKGPLTIAEVSRMVGLKPDKVRRMINKSLEHLRAVMGKEWRDYERDFQ